MPVRYDAGDIIRFTYISPEKKDGTKQIFKEVMVLNKGWRDIDWGPGELLVHALDFKIMTEAERYVLREIFSPDPNIRKKRHRYPIITQILQKSDPITQAHYNPLGFYKIVVKPFMKNKKLYRQYYPSRMSSIQLVSNAPEEVSTTSPIPNTNKPLFTKL